MVEGQNEPRSPPQNQRKNKMNKNIEIGKFKGTDWKYAKVRITCHTDEGPMISILNVFDDTADSTMRIGRKKAKGLLDGIFGKHAWRWISSVVSCVEDEKWGKKHMPDVMEFGPDCCFKVVAEALVFPQTMEYEIKKQVGGDYIEYWKVLQTYYREVMGKNLNFVPNFPPIPWGDKMRERWMREVLQISAQPLYTLD